MKVAPRIHEMGMSEKYGISVYPGQGTVDGVRGDHILLAPAYGLSKDDVETIVEKVVGLIEGFFGAL